LIQSPTLNIKDSPFFFVNFTTWLFLRFLGCSGSITHSILPWSGITSGAGVGVGVGSGLTSSVKIGVNLEGAGVGEAGAEPALPSVSS
jgi:hypothetical protein